jgi:hypothetical protein
VRIAANPRIPTLEEAMAQALTEDDAARFQGAHATVGGTIKSEHIGPRSHTYSRESNPWNARA